MIEVKHLVKNYGKHEALKDVSFSVEDGQIVGLLGPNGAGKSTTMNIMTGYLSATSGQVEIDGYDILEEPMKAKRQIGYLPEIPPLYEDMTVKEYLSFVCDLKKVKNRKETIGEVSEAAGIDEILPRLIRNLSKGYRQRVGLAQALVGNPKVLILDEPTVGLDPYQIIEIRALIRSLGKKHTVILSSHILSEVNEVCDHVLILDDGQLVAEDTPEHLSDDYADKNLILMTVKGEREKIEAVLKDADFVENYVIKDDEDAQEGMVNVQVQTASGQDVRDKMFFAFAKEELPIVRLEKETLSLEQVFLKLTGQDAGQAAAQADAKAERLDEQETAQEETSDEHPDKQEAAPKEDPGGNPESHAGPEEADPVINDGAVDEKETKEEA